MLEKKVRAWDKVTEEYIYSDKFPSMWQFYKELENRGIRHYETEDCTGLKGKNGKEGYHKDLCQHPTGLYCIEWIATDAKFVLMQIQEGILKGNTIDVRYLGTMEIIGNIYENPKLLGVNNAN